MRNEPRSLYQILGVPTNAKPDEIDRAYRRIKREQQKETTPPDQRLRVMLEHAHDVLMDPVRREQYDKQWFAPIAQIERARRSRIAMAAIAAAVVSVGVAAWMALREPEPAAAPAARSRQEVQDAASQAVGRVVRIEPSGAKTTLGLAFAIAEGILVTSCEGLTPGAEVLVQFGKRAAPVRPGSVDDGTGLCKLDGANVGSWPLSLARAGARYGQPAYLPRVGTTGAVQLADTEVRKNRSVGAVQGFDTVAAPNPQDLGAPLLDHDGRVLGAASRIAGTLLYVPVPHAWVPVIRVERAAPEPKPAPVETTPAEGEAVPGAPRPPGPNISPERRERLEKAFRPPPQVPADL